MKVSKSLEQGIFVLIMLALQKDHKAVKSYVLSKRLDVSDSYLKKILRKLVVAELIQSSASKDGGFQLLKPITEITLYDVYVAIENNDVQNFKSDIARKLFDDEAHVRSSEEKIIAILGNALNEFKKLKVSDILIEEKYSLGAIDWQNFDKERIK